MNVVVYLFVLFGFLLLSVGAFLKAPKKDSNSGKTSSVQTTESSGEKISTSKSRFLLPQLRPHLDTSYLLEFVTPDVPGVERMKPTIKKLEESFDTKVRVIDVTKKAEFYRIFELVGGNEVGAIPFYYNRRTSDAVAGVSPYWNLKHLAKGSTRCQVSVQEIDDNTQNVSDMTQREFGVVGKLIDNFFLASKGKGKKTKEKQAKKPVLDTVQEFFGVPKS
jgi:hypothetical protein